MYIKCRKVKDNCHYIGKYRGAAHNICKLRYKNIKINNGSTYDYHFIIKELAKEFKRQFECLGENTEKYIFFSVPTKKHLDNGKTVIYKLKFIDSFRFMSTSLSILIKKLSEGLNNDKCINCKSYLDYMSIKDDQRSCTRLILRCFKWEKIMKKISKII